MIENSDTCSEQFTAMAQRRFENRRPRFRVLGHVAGGLALVLALGLSAGAQSFVQQGSKLTASDTLGPCPPPANSSSPCSAQGWSVALSADGNTAIVGGDQDNGNKGASWIYTRSGTTWTEQAKLVGTGGVANGFQGVSVALSADGNTALVGGFVDNTYIGGAWVFTRSGSTWTQQGGKLTANNGVGSRYAFGYSVSLSSDGNTALIGGPADNSDIGAAWVFTRSSGVWSQSAKLVGTGYVGQPSQGTSVSLSGDASTAIVGGPFDASNVGAVWVFTQNAGSWTQQGSKIVAPDHTGTSELGISVSTDSNGNIAAFGGIFDNTNAGAVWVYTRSGTTWTEKVKLLGTGATGGAEQGTSVALSSDGTTLLEGGYADNNFAGAAWLFSNNGTTWVQQGNKLVGSGAVNPAWQGESVALSQNGTTGLIGGPSDNNATGATWVYSSAVITPMNPLGFFPITPCRIVDTRQGHNTSGAFGPPSMSANSQRNFPLTSSDCGLPASADAFSLNFTVVPPGSLPFLSVWPTGQPYPNVSTLNSPDGSTLANAAIVDAGTNGSITVLAGGGSTDLIIDTNGYFSAPTGNFLEFYPLTPCRIADTRPGHNTSGAFGPPSLTANSTRNFPLLSSACNIPGSAEAFSLNFTVVPQGTLPYLSAWPTGQPYPNVSTLNSNDGTTLANAAIVPAGAPNGSITILSGGNTDLIIDINGYFAAPSVSGLHFYAITPCRVADTRAGQGFGGAFGPPTMAANSQRDFPIQLSSCSIPAAAQVYSLNVTSVPQGPLPYLSIWPAGQPYPDVSTLNSPKGTIIANAALVPAGSPNGGITILAGGTTDVILDINGYFAP